MAEAPAQPRTTPPVTAPVVSGGARESGPLPTARSRRRYRVVLVGLLVLAVGLGFAHLAVDNPMPVGSEGFWLVAQMRGS